MHSSYDESELLYDYKLEKHFLIKSLEGKKRILVMMINSVQKSSKAKDGETRRQKEERHFNLYTCSEYIPQVREGIEQAQRRVITLQKWIDEYKPGDQRFPFGERLF
ncbi:hypothetical protein PILCRDRAFT_814141 [Piloderma croceum F 1598]|uniref:Uncharacterized protein n=1 Tax=Piloderma croceum (strain F 1598) TaxID=765440 RepID=A0A0C3BP37_PILCF|nr:hypothetical protein PILCRDRAFT_814141 [Piloderma croceum F 1598]